MHSRDHSESTPANRAERRFACVLQLARRRRSVTWAALRCCGAGDRG